MATVATSASASPLGLPHSSGIDRAITPSGIAGYLFAMVRTATGVEIFRSINSGTSWSSYASFTRANLQDLSSLYVNTDGYGNIVYRTYESGQDRLFYRRIDMRTGTPVVGGETLLAVATIGAAGGYYQGIDMVCVKSGSTWYYCIAVGTIQGAQNGCVLTAITVNSAGSVTVNGGLAGATRKWLDTGSAPVRPSIDIEHSGDGKNGIKNVWLAWHSGSTLRIVRNPWNGAGWSGSAGPALPTTDVDPQEWTSARWTGNEFAACYISDADTTTVGVSERNRAHSASVTRTTPAHPQGAVRACAITYDATTRDLYVFAVGTTTPDLYRVTWTRLTNTWGSWAVVSTTDILTGTPAVSAWNIRRGTYGNSRTDVFTAHAGPTQVHTAMAQAQPPNTPTWLYGTAANVPTGNGVPMDVASSLVLDWAFTDPDAADTQSAYALSRQVRDSGGTLLTIEYWNAGTSLWQAGEVFNTSGTSALTLTATQWSTDGAASGDSDRTHTFKVKVRDSTALDSGYSTGLDVVPSAKVVPVITSPTAASVQTVARVPVVWTSTGQTAYRLLSRNTSTPGVFLTDTGVVTSTALTATADVDFPDGADITVELYTANSEGLLSNVVTRQFTVDYVEPATPTLVVTPVPASGWMSVAITNPAPGGGQPALVDQDLFRRVVGDTSDGVRVGTGLASGATHLDNRARSTVAYQYRAQAFGVNGTSMFSAWTS